MPRHTIAIALSALVVALGACSTTPAPAPTVGVLLPLSGPYAEVGDELRRGLDLERERLRSSRGEDVLRVEVVDTAGRPGRAEALARELVDRDVIALVGGVSEDEADAIGNVASKHQTVFVSLSPSGDVEGRLSFRLVPSEDDVAVALASFAARSPGRNEVSVLSAASTVDGVDEVFVSGLRQSGGDVVATFEYGPVAGDLDDLLRSALDERPRALFVSGPAVPVTKILSGLGERRYPGTVLTSSLLAVETLIARDEAVPSGTTLVLGRGRFEAVEDDPMTGAFVARFQERNGRRPGIYAAYGADAITALHTAWSHESDGGAVGAERLWRGLRALDGEPGVTGYLQFDERGEIGSYPRVYRVDGADQTALELSEVAVRRSTSPRSADSPAG